MSFDWNKIINTNPGQESTTPPANPEIEPVATEPVVAPLDLSSALQAAAPEPTYPPAEPTAVGPVVTGNMEDIPFAQYDEAMELSKKKGIEPTLDVLPTVSGVEATPKPQISGMPPVQRPEVFENFPQAAQSPVSSVVDASVPPLPPMPASPVGPPPLDNPDVLKGTTAEIPPVTASAPPAIEEPPAPIEENNVLSIFNKPLKTQEPKPAGPPPTISDLNSADRNSTVFDAHIDRTASVSKYDGGEPIAEVHIDEILKAAVERKCSDIHFTVGVPPMIRVDGEMQPLNYMPLQSSDIRRIMYDTLDDDRLQKFETTRELDFSYPVKGVGRFRVNMFQQRGSVGAVLRVIPQRIPAFEELGLPQVIREMSKRTSGLILVTGPTGSGKSTTIASMIDDINSKLRGHIMTIEDPIEYLHNHKQCIINQREMHTDTFSFHNALRAVLREDPDIILVGELRDLETIEAALTLAETGHLVFGTLHTRNAPSTIDRIIDVFPPDSQEQIRVLLANTIEGIVSQQLLPKLGGGRCAAIEIMLGTPAIKNLVREGKTHQMQSIVETSGNSGMQTMDASLAELYRSGKCEYDECLMRAIDKDGFGRLARAA